MVISLIVAVAKNGVIGCDSGLPWDSAEDMAHFKKITSGSAIIMGRKTFDLVGVLPNRKTFVLSHVLMGGSSEYEYVDSLESALSKCSDSDVFICGGAEVYSLAIPYVDRMYITRFNFDASGGVLFPSVDYSEWKRISFRHFSDGVFEVYERR